jgi:hypothetical protein
VATGARERGPQRAGDGAVERRAGEHEHRALRARRARVDDRRAARREVLLRLRDRDQLGRHAAALERGAHPRRERRGEHHGVAGQQRRAGLQHRLGPRRGAAAADADDAERRGHDHRAAPRAQRGDAPEPPVAQRARSVVGQVVQPADRRQQLGEHRLRARLADAVGQRVGERVELVEDRRRRAPQVASAPRGGDERPQRLGRGALH